MADETHRYRGGLEDSLTRWAEGRAKHPEPAPFDFLRALMSEPPSIEGQWFNGQDINLDGYRFLRCRFDNCKLTTIKGTFKLDHCFICGGSIHYLGEASNVVRLFTSNQRDQPTPFGLMPVFHEDGTFSIL